MQNIAAMHDVGIQQYITASLWWLILARDVATMDSPSLKNNYYLHKMTPF